MDVLQDFVKLVDQANLNEYLRLLRFAPCLPRVVVSSDEARCKIEEYASCQGNPLEYKSETLKS
jgi:hypothetical protein